MVIPASLAIILEDHSDAVSSYKSLIPDGDIILYDQHFTGTHTDIGRLIQQAQTCEIQKLAVNVDMLTEELVFVAHANDIEIGAFNADTDIALNTLLNIGIDFFTTKEPITYLMVTSPKLQKIVNKAHAAVFFAWKWKKCPFSYLERAFGQCDKVSVGFQNF